jgi:hypothetical protein
MDTLMEHLMLMDRSWVTPVLSKVKFRVVSAESTDIHLKSVSEQGRGSIYLGLLYFLILILVLKLSESYMVPIR